MARSCCPGPRIYSAQPGCLVSNQPAASAGDLARTVAGDRRRVARGTHSPSARIGTVGSPARRGRPGRTCCGLHRRRWKVCPCSVPRWPIPPNPWASTSTTSLTGMRRCSRSSWVTTANGSKCIVASRPLMLLLRRSSQRPTSGWAPPMLRREPQRARPDDLRRHSQLHPDPTRTRVGRGDARALTAGRRGRTAPQARRRLIGGTSGGHARGRGWCGTGAGCRSACEPTPAESSSRSSVSTCTAPLSRSQRGSPRR
jgi:hypothetical protein